MLSVLTIFKVKDVLIQLYIADAIVMWINRLKIIYV